MSIATLLIKTDEATFAFEHAMATRNYLGVMWPLTQFSVLPYLIDPEYDTQEPATKWHLNHQQAHNDVLATLPAYREAEVHIGAYNGQILSESDLSNQDELTWWTFANEREHYVLNDTLLPIEVTEWRFPFW